LRELSLRSSTSAAKRSDQALDLLLAMRKGHERHDPAAVDEIDVDVARIATPVIGLVTPVQMIRG
jgi:hypothetical protein